MPPDGIEQPGYPMPFADVRLPDGRTVFTNSSGVAGCFVPPVPSPPLPPLETRLSGRYVHIIDGCGAVSETFPLRSRRPANLGNGPGIQEVATFSVDVAGPEGAVAVSNAHGTVTGAAGGVLLRPFARLIASTGDSVTTYGEPWNMN